MNGTRREGREPLPAFRQCGLPTPSARSLDELELSQSSQTRWFNKAFCLPRQLIFLGDDDVVEVPGNLVLALLAVRPVSYSERPLHAWLKVCPRADCVLRPRMPELLARGRGRRRRRS